MTHIIIAHEIDLRMYTTETQTPSCMSAIKQITLGDLHSNANKLVFTLLHHGICTMTLEKYSQLNCLYHNNINTLQDRLEYDELILQHLTIINHNVLVRLIGDELSDRGQNDYFILKILEKLSREGVAFEILFSNHGANFNLALASYEQNSHQLLTTTIQPNFTLSLIRLNDCLQANLMEIDPINAIYKQFYLPHIKLISSSIDLQQNSLTIYSHAGIGLLQIQWAAQLFGIPFKDETPHALAEVIESINYEFSTIIARHELGLYFTVESINRVLNGTAGPNDVIAFIAWNRDYRSLLQPKIHQGYHLQFVHGHDIQNTNAPHIINLDNTLGKTMDEPLGVLETLVSNDIQLKEWQLTCWQATFDDSEASSPLSSRSRSPVKHKTMPLKRQSMSDQNLFLVNRKKIFSAYSNKQSLFSPTKTLKRPASENSMHFPSDELDFLGLNTGVYPR